MTSLIISVKSYLSVDIAALIDELLQRHAVTQASGVHRRIGLNGIDHHTGSRIDGAFADAFDPRSHTCQLLDVVIKARHFDLRQLRPPTPNGYSRCLPQTAQN